MHASNLVRSLLSLLLSDACIGRAYYIICPLSVSESQSRHPRSPGARGAKPRKMQNIESVVWNRRVAPVPHNRFNGERRRHDQTIAMAIRQTLSLAETNGSASTRHPLIASLIITTEIGKMSAHWRRRPALRQHMLPVEPAVLLRQDGSHELLREAHRCNLPRPAAQFLAPAARSTRQTTAEDLVLSLSNQAASPVLASTVRHPVHSQARR